MTSHLDVDANALISHDARIPRLPQMPVLRLDALELTP